MSVQGHTKHSDQSRTGLLSSRVGLVLLGFLTMAGILLFTEHRAHVLGALLYVPLLLCPLMHLFMHRGHGHGSHQQRDIERAS